MLGDSSLYIASSCGAMGGGVGYVVAPQDDPLVPTFAAAYLGQAVSSQALSLETAAVLVSDTLWEALGDTRGPADPRAAAVRASLSRRVKTRPGAATAVLLMPSGATDVSALVSAMAGVSISCALMDPFLGTPLGSRGGSWPNRVASSAATAQVPDATAVEWISCSSARAQALAAVTVGGASRPLAVSITVPGGGTLRLISFNLLNVAPGVAAAAVTADVDTACSAPPPAPAPPAPPPPGAWAPCADCSGVALLGVPRAALTALAALPPSLAELSNDLGPRLVDAFGALAFPDLTPAYDADVAALVYDAPSLFMSDAVLKQALTGPASGPALLRRVRRRPATATTVLLSEPLAGAAAALLRLLTGNDAAECGLVQARSGRLVAGGGRPTWTEGIAPANGTAPTRPTRLDATTTGGGGGAVRVSLALSCAAGGPAPIVARVVADVSSEEAPVVVEVRPYANGGLLRLVPAALLLTHPGTVRAALTEGVTERPCSALASPPPRPPPSPPPPGPRPPAPPSPQPPPSPPLPRYAADVRYREGLCMSSVQVPSDAATLEPLLRDYFPPTASVASLPSTAPALLLSESALRALVEAVDDSARQALVDWSRGPGRTITLLLSADPGASTVTLLTALNAYTRMRCGLTDPSTGALLQSGASFASSVGAQGAAALDGVERVPGVACASPAARAEAVAADTGAPLIVTLPLATGATLRLASLALMQRSPSDLAAAVLAGTPACRGLPPPPPAPAPPRGLLTYLGVSGSDEGSRRGLSEGAGGSCVTCVLAANEDPSFAAFVESAFPELRPLPSLGLDAPALLLSTAGWDLLNRFGDRALLTQLFTWTAQSSLTLALSDTASAASIGTALAKLTGSDGLRCGLVEPASVTPRLSWNDSAVVVPPLGAVHVLPYEEGLYGISCASGAELAVTATAVTRAGGGRVPVAVEVALPAGGRLRLVAARSLAVVEFAEALAADVWGDAPECVAPAPPPPRSSSKPPGAPPLPSASNGSPSLQPPLPAAGTPPAPPPLPPSGRGGAPPAAVPSPSPSPPSIPPEDAGPEWTSGCVSYSDASGGGTAVLLPSAAAWAAADPAAAALAALLPGLPAAAQVRAVGDIPSGAANVVILDSDLTALSSRLARLLAAVAATPGRAVTVVVGPAASDDSIAELMRRLGLGRAACAVAVREPDGAPSRLDCSLRQAMRADCPEEGASTVVPIVTPTGGRVRLVPSASLRATSSDPEGVARVAALLSGYRPPSPPPPPPSPPPPTPPEPPAGPPPEPFPGWKAQVCRPAFGPCEARKAKNRMPYSLANGTSARTSPLDGWHEVLMDLPPLNASDASAAAEEGYAVMFMCAPECVGSMITIALVAADGSGAGGAKRPTPVAAHYHTFLAPRSGATPDTECSTLKVPKLGLTPALAAQPGNRLLLRFQPSAKCSTLAQLCGGYLAGQCVYAFTGPGYDYCPVRTLHFTPGS
ncbi:hypothetical protein HYH03_016036 [Edaphochlamys debaryana]|uniref:Uncharacterized protein n=1 Tax=Edaphochlamys debaryana TaxID=47281 RepID=A0A835XKU2_9CHLO|nr:hypothetical protein HYH03_016036 [Edaphochlamys debaryana]|eukprot:KAG2485250.1 hypothetical protein HYH03_016036 [Edaphochlamys debaryana]